jgi:hypothetical protein
MRYRAIVALVVVGVAALAGALAPTGPTGAAVPAGTGSVPHGTPEAHRFAGSRTVGPLFPPGSPIHTCTASVVDSRAGNLLITASHCISGTAKGYTFVPGYRDGAEPFGSWTVTGAYASPQWITRRSPQLDLAFLVVAPRRVHGLSEQIQAVTGANQLGTAPSRGMQITVPAYPTGRDDLPLTCTTRVYFRGAYPAFNCNPYVDGTSGSPWLRRGRRGWVVVGVIGGLHQGGCYPWTSYSAPFGPDTLRTYADAAGGGQASIFPDPESDGCTTGL